MNDAIQHKMYIKLFYSFKGWRWYKDGNTMRVYVHLMLCANRKDQPYHKDVIRRGEVLASLEFLARELGLTVPQVRTAISHLKATGEITSRIIDRVSIYRITSFEEYQFPEASEIDESPKKQHIKKISEAATEAASEIIKRKERQIDSKLTAIQQQGVDRLLADYQQHLENEENEDIEDIEDNEESEEVVLCGKFSNVMITQQQHKQFKKDYPDICDEVIDQLSEKILFGEDRYKKGHAGHLYSFARNYRPPKKNTAHSFFDSGSQRESVATYDIEEAMRRSLRIDPKNTKRRQN